VTVASTEQEPGQEAEVAQEVAQEVARPQKRPLYPRLLRLKNVHPNAWQRAALGEGAFGVAALLCLADVASLWTLVALPVAVAAVVKAHDVVAGVLQSPGGGTDRG
jgi:hypothetical protein